MNTLSHRRWCLVILTVSTLLLQCSDMPANAVDMGNVSEVLGVVVKSDGEGNVPVAGAVVEMRTSRYLGHIESLGKKRGVSDTTAYFAVTDSNGRYKIDSVPSGVYTIVTGDDSSLLAIVDSVIIDYLPEYGSVVVDTPTLMPTVTLQGRVNWIDSSMKAYIAVGGTHMIAPIAADGSYALRNIPQGKLRIQCLVFRDGESVPDTTPPIAVTLSATALQETEKLFLAPEVYTVSDTLVRISGGESCTLSVATNGAYGCTYVWYKDSVVIDTTDTFMLVVYDNASDSVAGKYWCSISNQWGSSSSAAVTLRVVPLYRVSIFRNSESSSDNMLFSQRFEKGEFILLAYSADSIMGPGFSFDGWNTGENSSENLYQPGDTLTVDTNDVMLHMQWTALPRHSVVYDGNGNSSGSAPVDTCMYYISQAVTVAADTGRLEKTGHTFLCWNSEDDGSGTDFIVDSAFAMQDTDITLFAKWNPDEYTVSFNTAGGGDVAAQKVCYLKCASKPADPTRTGYIFKNWYTDSNYSYEWSFSEDTIVNDTALFAKWARENYTVVYSTNGNGVVFGPAIAEYSVPAAISAEAGKGYRFDKWESVTGTVQFDNNRQQNTSAVLTGGASEIRAVFVLVKYVLSVEADEHGTIVNRPETGVTHGSSAVIEAAADSGYHFTGWRISDGYAVIEEPAAAVTSVMMDSIDTKVAASFAINRYRLFKTAQNGGVEGADSVDHGGETSVVAVADSGYLFDGWVSDSGEINIDSSGAAQTVVTLTKGNARLKALFKLRTYQLAITNSDSGKTTGSGEVFHKERRRIIAQPATGYQFVRWEVTSGSVEITDSLNDTAFVVLKSGDAAIRALFTRIICPITVLSGENGRAGSSGTAEYGAAYQVTAQPIEHFHLATWETVSGTVDISDVSMDTTTIRVFSLDASVKASFEADRYSLVVVDTGIGSITGDTTVPYNVTIPITATPAQGYLFDHWEVVSGSATIGSPADSVTTVLLSSNTSVRAVFIPRQYPLTIMAGEHGSVNDGITELTTYHNIPCQVVAVADTGNGYHFDHWETPVPDVVTFADSMSAMTTVFVTDSNASISAQFSLNSYKVSIQNGGNGSGTTECTRVDGTALAGDSMVLHGDTVGLIAYPDNTSSEFDGWVFSRGLLTGSPTARDNFAVVKENGTSIVAQFKLKRYALTVMAPGEGGSIIADSGLYEHNKKYTIEAFPDSQFNFTGWRCSPQTNAKIENAAAASTTVELTGAVNLYAQFERIPLLLTITTVGEGSGTVTVNDSAVDGSDTLLHSLGYRLNAVAVHGSCFDHWEADANVKVTGDTTASAVEVKMAEGNGNIRAVFKLMTYTVTLEKDSNGTVEPKPGTVQVQYGTSKVFTAMPYKLAGYKVEKWEMTNAPETAYRINTLTDTSIALTVYDSIAEAVLKVHFIKKQYELTVENPVDEKSGTVGSMYLGVRLVDHGFKYPIKATPNYGYDSLRWIVGNISTVYPSLNDSTPDYIALWGGNDTVRPLFKSKNYTLTIVVDNPVMGSTDRGSSVSVNHFDSVSITATPKSMHRFDHWSTSDTSIVVHPMQSHTAMIKAHSAGTVSAHFVRIDTLTILRSDGGMPVDDVQYVLDFGVSHIVEADPKDGYEFDRWRLVSGTVDDSVFVSGSPSTVVYCAGVNVTLQPVYRLKQYLLTVLKTPLSADATVAPQSGVMVDHGVVYDCSATPQFPFQFVQWSTPAPAAIKMADPQKNATTFICTGVATLQAEFEYVSFPLVVSVSDPDGGTIVSQVTGIQYGETVTLEAVVNADYQFIGWQSLTVEPNLLISEPLSPSTTIQFTPGSSKDTVRIQAQIQINQ